MEKTLVLLKPDAIQRNLVGKIISRFEDTGLKIAAMKMKWINKGFAGRHYPLDEEWAKKVYIRTKEAYDKIGKAMEYRDHMHMGTTIRERNMQFLQEGPIIAMVFEGPSAVEIVRKIIGHTEPRQALPGTIRGDFASVESYAVSDPKKRTLRTLVHASDSVENAKREISLWFKKEEMHDYKKELDKFF